MKKIITLLLITAILPIASVSAAKQSKVEKTTLWRQPTNVLETLVVGQTLFGQKFEKRVFGRAGGTYYGGSNDYSFEAIFSHLPRYKDEQYFYQAWLYNQSIDTYISVGTSLGQPTLKRVDSRINFSTKQNLSNYDIFILSLESVEWNKQPTQRIIEWEIALRILENDVRLWSERVEPPKKSIQTAFVSKISPSQQKRIETVLSGVSRSKLLILKARINRLKDSSKIDSLNESTRELLDFIEDTTEDLLKNWQK